MRRRRWDSGLMESIAIFKRRKFHTNACKKLVAQKRPASYSRHRCRHCDDPIIRKRYGNGGRLEDVDRFRKRQFCSSTCRYLWLEDPLHRQEYGDRISAALGKSIRWRANVALRRAEAEGRQSEREQAKKLAIDAEKKAKRQLERRQRCFHGNPKRDCVFCARIEGRAT